MATLSSTQRKLMNSKDFALPGKRAYPIGDENHARAALSMLHNASPSEQEQIKAAVKSKYPGIKQGK
jgi:hypothetical protein